MDECDDTDSNKTEVEEIEMVDMEGRAEVALFSYSVPLSSTEMNYMKKFREQKICLPSRFSFYEIFLLK